MRTIQGTPTVTVLMPVLNAMPYLKAAVESLREQTFGDFIVMAIDDGSTDGSVEYLRSIHDPRLCILSDGVHHGMGAALNFALARVSTPFVARMDADDLCSGDRFALQLAFLAKHPEVGAVGTQFVFFGNTGKTGFERRLPLVHEEIYQDLNTGTLSVIHASLMIRTSLLQQIGGYRFDGVGEDWDMFLRLGEVTRFANLLELCYYYRLHGRNASTLHRQLTQERIGYACRCAAARRSGVPEPTESQYREELHRSGAVAKWRRQLDAFSLAHFTNGRNLILNGRSLAGYGHLVIGAAAGPSRVASRLSKSFFRLRRSITPGSRASAFVPPPLRS
jgi:glycosyltransferase involved in cell wall biosynthesis